MPDCALCNRPITLKTNQRCKKCGSCQACCRCPKPEYFAPTDAEVGLASFDNGVSGKVT